MIKKLIVNLVDEIILEFTNISIDIDSRALTLFGNRTTKAVIYNKLGKEGAYNGDLNVISGHSIPLENIKKIEIYPISNPNGTLMVNGIDIFED